MSKNIFVRSLFFSFALTLSAQAQDLVYNYAELQTKSLDEMNAVVGAQQQKARRYIEKDDDKASALVALKAAVRFVLARPDRDENMVSKVITPLRAQLNELKALESTLDQLVTESVETLKNEKNKPLDRGTHYFILVNFLAEFKPDLSRNSSWRAIYTKVADAKIKIDKKLKSELAIRIMRRNITSPSELARQILKDVKPVPQTSAESPEGSDNEPEFD